MVLENSDVTSFFAWACCSVTTTDIGWGVNVALVSLLQGQPTYCCSLKSTGLSKTVSGEGNTSSTREEPGLYRSASSKRDNLASLSASGRGDTPPDPVSTTSLVRLHKRGMVSLEMVRLPVRTWSVRRPFVPCAVSSNLVICVG